MRLGSNLIWPVSLSEEESWTQPLTEGRRYEDIGRRQPPTGHGDKPGAEPSLTALRRTNPADTWSWTSGLWICDTIHFCCLSHPGHGTLLGQPLLTKALPSHPFLLLLPAETLHPSGAALLIVPCTCHLHPSLWAFVYTMFYIIPSPGVPSCTPARSPGVRKPQPWVRSRLPPVLYMKSHWNTTTSVCLCVTYGCLPTTTTESNSCTRGSTWPAKPEIFTNRHFRKKVCWLLNYSNFALSWRPSSSLWSLSGPPTGPECHLLSSRKTGIGENYK